MDMTSALAYPLGKVLLSVLFLDLIHIIPDSDTRWGAL